MFVANSINSLLAPGDRYNHARAKVNYHWHKARRHALNALGLPQGFVTFMLGRRSMYHWHKARWHALNAPGFTPGDRYLHARAKANYHWHKARWHALNAPGFIPGVRYLHARAKVNYHWRKARWHALNAPGVTPSCLPTSFDLAPLALVSWRGGENAMGSRPWTRERARSCHAMVTRARKRGADCNPSRNGLLI